MEALAWVDTAPPSDLNFHAGWRVVFDEGVIVPIAQAITTIFDSSNDYFPWESNPRAPASRYTWQTY